MHISSIHQFGVVFSKNTNNLQSWTKLLRQNRKPKFKQKNPSLTKFMSFAKLWAFDKKPWPGSTLI